MYISKIFKTAVIGIFVFGVAAAHAQEKVASIASGTKVAFEYTLTVDGEVVDTSIGKKPFEYTHGSAGIIPGLAAQLEGLRVGDERAIVVEPVDGYGMVDPQAFGEFAKERLPRDLKLAVGMPLTLWNPSGRPAQAIVSEIKKDSVVLNFNHPLAGKQLKFDVKIVAIEQLKRPAGE